MSIEMTDMQEDAFLPADIGKQREEAAEIRFLKEHYRYFGTAALLYGIFYAVCMYQNPAGITFPFVVAASFGLCILGLRYMGRSIKRSTWPYVLLAVLLGTGVCLTASEVLRTFHKAGAFLLLLLFMTEQIYGNENWSIEDYAGHFFWKGIHILGGCYYPFAHYKAYREEHRKKVNPGRKYIYMGVGIAVPVSLLVLLLLARADEIFSHLFGTLLRNILVPTRFLGAFLMAVAAFVFMYSFFAVNIVKKEKNRQTVKRAEPVTAIIVTGALTGIYLLFCVIQVMYLFAGGIFRLPEGMTYSEYARQGFFELLFVSLLNLAIVTLCVEHVRENKILKVCLTVVSGCTYILICSSAYRMVLYIRQYHLTFLRMLVLWFLGVLTIWLTGAIVSIYHNKINYFKFAVAVGAVGYLGFALARPDAWIARYNISHMEELSYGDIAYMTQALSDDAAPEIAGISKSQWKVQDWEYISQELASYHDRIYLQYRDLPVRKWNLGKELAKKAVGDQQTGGYE